MTRTLGVVLAGGRGRRLGLDVPKALARLGDRTLLDRAIETLERICDSVLVAARAALALPIDPARRVNDAPEAEAPLAGIVAALGRVEHERAIVLGVDFPFARAGALAALLDLLPGHPAVVPAPGGIPQPLVAAYAGTVAPLLEERWRRGERSIQRAALEIGARLLSDEEIAKLEGGAANFFNLNTAADLARAHEMIQRATEGIA